MLTSYGVDKVRIDKGSVRYGRTNKRGGEHKCVASGVWKAAHLAGEGPIFRPHVQSKVLVSIRTRDQDGYKIFSEF